MSSAFHKFIMHDPLNLFDQLHTSSQFENITTGRYGATLVDYRDSLVPIVRTTTNYKNPSQQFLPIHHDIIDKIKKHMDNGIQFNNALIEVYDQRYFTMVYHSDQALDLDENSYICLFSCYSNPLTKNIRKLTIKSKCSNTNFDIVLDHNSFVLFSVRDNRQYLHKIVLDVPNNKKSGEFDVSDLWLGITFRQSKTLIYFNNEIPYFKKNDKQLSFATNEQKKQFYKYRSIENTSSDQSLDEVYPDDIHYTISAGDLIPI